MCYFIPKFPFFLHYLFTLQCQYDFFFWLDVGILCNITQEAQDTKLLIYIKFSSRYIFERSVSKYSAVFEALFALIAMAEQPGTIMIIARLNSHSSEFIFILKFAPIPDFFDFFLFRRIDENFMKKKKIRW